MEEKKKKKDWLLDDEGQRGSFGLLMIFYYRSAYFESYFTQNE